MSSLLLNSKACSPMLMFIREGHRMRGKAPGIAKTLSQRLAEEKFEDPELHRKIDIGYPFIRPGRSAELKVRLDHLKAHRNDTNLEKLARSHKLQIDMNEVKTVWKKTGGPFQLRKIAEHYGIFKDLFGKHAYFTPRVTLSIKFKQSDDVYCPVHYGNQITPSEAMNAPEVSFDGNFSFEQNASDSKQSLWTLIMTNPDSNFTEENMEYVHWMVANIPGGDVSKGEQIVPYIQPFPPKGTGLHRHAFVLYKQEKKIDFAENKIKDPNSLAERSFNTFEFYRKHQDNITPAGLSFFQSRWNESLTSFYHNVLNMKEPIYDYDYPEGFLNKQVQFPHRKPFNLYMDKFMDPKDVNKRYIEEKLSKTHPFEGPEPPLRFPNAHFFGKEPSWLKTEYRKRRMRLGRINDAIN